MATVSEETATQTGERKRGRPPGPPIDRAIRRAQLLEAAARAIRRDGARVSMEGLAKEAGVTKPVLYAHFGDKAGLTRALADRFTSDLGTRLLEVLAEQRDEQAMLRAAIESFMSMVEAEPQVYQFMLQHGLGGEPSIAPARGLQPARRPGLPHDRVGSAPAGPARPFGPAVGLRHPRRHALHRRLVAPRPPHVPRRPRRRPHHPFLERPVLHLRWRCRE